MLNFQDYIDCNTENNNINSNPDQMLKMSFKTILNAFDINIKNYETKIIDLNNIISDYESKLNELNNQIEIYKNQNQNILTENNNLKQEIISHKNKLEEIKNNISDISTKNNILENNNNNNLFSEDFDINILNEEKETLNSIGNLTIQNNNNNNNNKDKNKNRSRQKNNYFIKNEQYMNNYTTYIPTGKNKKSNNYYSSLFSYNTNSQTLNNKNNIIYNNKSEKNIKFNDFQKNNTIETKIINLKRNLSQKNNNNNNNKFNSNNNFYRNNINNNSMKCIRDYNNKNKELIPISINNYKSERYEIKIDKNNINNNINNNNFNEKYNNNLNNELNNTKLINDFLNQCKINLSNKEFQSIINLFENFKQNNIYEDEVIKKTRKLLKNKINLLNLFESIVTVK